MLRVFHDFWPIDQRVAANISMDKRFETMHQKLDHVIEHHPDIPPLEDE